jgi:hypothetical protein
MTGYSPSEANRNLSSADTSCIQKPFSPYGLAEKVREVLQARDE